MTNFPENASSNALLHYLERIAVALEDISEKLGDLVSLEEEFEMEAFEDFDEEDWEQDDDDDDDEEEEGADSLPADYNPSLGGEQFNDTGRTIYDTNDPANLGSDRH